MRRVRDDTLPKLGVRLEDRPDGTRASTVQGIQELWGLRRVRDDTLPKLGVRLEDRPDGTRASTVQGIQELWGLRRVRDDTLPKLGVRLEDRPNGTRALLFREFRSYGGCAGCATTRCPSWACAWRTAPMAPASASSCPPPSRPRCARARPASNPALSLVLQGTDV